MYRECLQLSVFVQYVVWVSFPVVFICFSAGFVHMVGPTATGQCNLICNAVVVGLFFKKTLTPCSRFWITQSNHHFERHILVLVYHRCAFSVFATVILRVVRFDAANHVLKYSIHSYNTPKSCEKCSLCGYTIAKTAWMRPIVCSSIWLG